MMEALLTNTPFLSLITLITAYVVSCVLSIVFNPLRKIPGPTYSLWTEWVMKYYIIKGKKAVYVHDLHKKYGPIVRITPTQIDVSDVAAAQRINSTKHDFVKTEWYKTMTVDEDNIFNTGDPKVHRRMRRLLAGPMSESGLRAWLPTVDAKVRFAVDRMGDEMNGERGAADVFKWATFMSADVIAELTFGESFSMLEEGRKHQYFRNMESAAPILALRAIFPLIRTLMSWGIPLPGAKKAAQMIDRTRAAAEEKLKRHGQLRAESSSSSSSPYKPTLLNKVHNPTEEAKGGDQPEDGGNGQGESLPPPPPLSPPELLSNAMLYIIAGTDTTAASLTYILWLVSRHPEVRDRLVSELRSAVSPSSSPSSPSEPFAFPPYQTLSNLPYLSAVLDESLRLYAPTPSPLPRRAPPAGLWMMASSSSAGDDNSNADNSGSSGNNMHWIPGGTVVSTQAYSLHRDGEVFGLSGEGGGRMPSFVEEEAGRFDPDRWVRLENLMEMGRRRRKGEEEEEGEEGDKGNGEQQQQQQEWAEGERGFRGKEAWKKLRKMRGAFMAFGGGARICLGMHLALMELRIAVAYFFLRFPNATVASGVEGFGDEDMEQVTYFMAFPKGKRCLIKASS